MQPTPSVDTEASAKQYAARSGFPYFDASDPSTLTGTDKLISLDTMRKYGVAPLHDYDDSLELGITENTNRSQLPALQTEVGDTKLTFKTISTANYDLILNHLFLNRFEKALHGDYEAFGATLNTAAPKDAFGQVAQLAFLMGASDIHIEPAETDTRIRFRLDGVLHPITSVKTDSYKVFLADLQTRAEIKWGTDVPQSGRISYDLVDSDGTPQAVNMRIETIPAFHGEEIVVRIFNNEPQQLQLEKLGFSEEQRELVEHTAAHANGMILTVGPTGSGKTSTLYALINKLNNDETKIITLEDPIEYDLPGISQIPVHTEDKELFAEKLRAVLREDPNIVMIGEIRDADTARTALQAALTGHLVLSTFHASSATAAISRLLDMTNNNPLLASAIHIIIAQRLVRRICPVCIESYEPSADERSTIESALARMPKGKAPVLAPDYQLHRGKGCPECHGIGYKGRVAVAEMMPLSPAMEELMTTGQATTAQKIQELAVSEGLVTLQQDGILKVLAGVTTLSEVGTIAEL